MSLMTEDALDVLHFAVVVHPEQVRNRTFWFARSVLTSTVAHGRTPEEALDGLRECLEVAIAAAALYETSPREWVESARPDEDRYVTEFCRLSLRQTESVRYVLEPDGCVLQATITRRRAA